MSRPFLYVAALLALVGVPTYAQQSSVEFGAGVVEVFDVDDEVRFVVELTRPVPWRVWFEDAPPRLVVEISELEVAKKPRLASTSVEDLVIEPVDTDRIELVALLREPFVVRSAEMSSNDEQAVLDIRLEPSTAAEFRAEASHAVASALPVVAIDPGHGGIDPGAETGSLDEADLVLGFAERLRDELVSSGRFDVVLTRDRDHFVSLDERLALARDAGADLFLSIHADALDGGAEASGMVVYSLSPSAEQRATARLTERHGDEDLLNGVDLSGAGDDVAHALLDLARSDNAPRTEALSVAMVQAFQTSGLTLNSRPERHGNFAVLKAADIPSLLLELGFLSTEQDLERLTSEEWQKEAARAIRNALTLWQDEDALR